MTYRDVAAARKIGARYLAAKAEEVNQGTRASTVLRDVIYNYARGEYF